MAAKVTWHPSGVGALWALLAVAVGASGAHLLSDFVSPERLTAFETGARYHMYHALGLVATQALPVHAHRVAPLLLAGSAVFSGSLYLLVLTNAAWLGAVTPVGGALQLAGWGWLAWLLLSRPRRDGAR